MMEVVVVISKIQCGMYTLILRAILMVIVRVEKLRNSVHMTVGKLNHAPIKAFIAVPPISSVPIREWVLVVVAVSSAVIL